MNAVPMILADPEAGSTLSGSERRLTGLTPLPVHQLIQGLGHGPHADYLALSSLRFPSFSLGSAGVALGDDATCEAHLRRFANSKRGLARATHLSGETHL